VTPLSWLCLLIVVRWSLRLAHLPSWTGWLAHRSLQLFRPALAWCHFQLMRRLGRPEFAAIINTWLRQASRRRDPGFLLRWTILRWFRRFGGILLSPGVTSRRPFLFMLMDQRGWIVISVSTPGGVNA
jgi:hypothetical protein